MSELKEIRILRISFNGELLGHEIPAFRGAIAKKVGFENVLFHNHLGKANFIYRYPLIQYKNLGGKPAIVCIEQGVDEIHHLFQQKEWSLKISGRTLDMKIENLTLNQFTLQICARMRDYHIKNWVALNAENYVRFLLLETDQQKKEMLAAILKANILSFAKGIEWSVSQPIETAFTSSPIETRTIKVKGNKLVAFNMNFKTNVFLPNYIGLGKSVSHGYGVVREKKRWDMGV